MKAGIFSCCATIILHIHQIVNTYFDNFHKYFDILHGFLNAKLPKVSVKVTIKQKQESVIKASAFVLFKYSVISASPSLRIFGVCFVML